MAHTAISDIIVPETWLDYTLQRTVELSALWEAGVLDVNSEFSMRADGGGVLVHLPYLDDLGSDDPNIPTDSDAVDGTPLATPGDKELAYVQNRNQGWGAADLAVEFAGVDPMRMVAERVANYWARANQRSLISSLVGVEAENLASDGGDMIHDVYDDTDATIDPAETIGVSSVVEAAGTMGDHLRDLVAIAMHSKVYVQLQKNQEIQQVAHPSDTNVTFDVYLGMRVIVDDGLPFTAGSNVDDYTSILFGANSVAYGPGTPKTPVEVDRDASQATGGGLEELWSRVKHILHPRGHQSAASFAGNSPTDAELAVAASWTRVWERKNVKIAFLHTTHAK